MADLERHHRDARNGLLGALIVLILQFVLGMATNLFVVVPRNHPGANPSEYFSGVASSVTWAIFQQGQIWLILHASLGLLLALFAIRLAVSAVLSRELRLMITAVIGGLAIIAAGFNGGSYLNYHEDFSSMLMATFFAISVLAFVVGLYVTPPKSA